MTQINRNQIHFLYFAPNLGAAWFFQAARRYWETYFPIIVHDLTIVAFVPEDYQIIITTIGRSDTATFIREEIEQQYPQAIHDPLVYDYLEDAQLTLDARLEANQPFGVPIEEE